MPRASWRAILTDADGDLAPWRVVLLGCLLAGWALLLTSQVLALRHVQSPFPGFLVEPSNVLTPFGHADWARFQVDPPIAEPEKLVQVDAEPVASNRELAALLRCCYRPGEEAFFTFVHPEGDTRTLRLLLTRWALRDVLDIFGAPHLVSLVILGLGTWVFISEKGPTSLVFAFSTVAFALSAGLMFETVTTGYLPRVWISAMSLTGATLVHLAVLFPEPVRFLRRRPEIQYLAYVPGLLLLIAGQLTLYHWPSSWAFIPTWRAIYAGVGLGMLCFLAMLIYRLRRPTSATVRHQSRIILMGATLAFAPTFFWFASNVVGVPRAFSGIYAPFLLLFPISVAYAILRYQLADVDAVFARGVTGALLILVGIALYRGLHYLLVTELGWLRAGDALLVAGFLLVFVLLFDPLRVRLEHLVDRLFLRAPVDYRAALQAFSHRLAGTLNLAQVVGEIGAQLTSVPAAWAALWLYDDAEQRYRPHDLGLGASGDEVWTPDADPVQRIAAENSAFVLNADRYPSDQALVQQGGQIAVPFLRQDHLIGWMLLGARADGVPYAPDDLEFLTALADQSVLALQNARLYHQAQQHLREVQGMKRLMDEVFASIPSGVITLDLRGRVTLFTPAVARMLNVTTEEVRGRPYPRALPDLSDPIERALPEVLKQEATVPLEASVVVPQRGMVYLRLNCAPLYDADGTVAGVTISVEDATRQRQLEDRAQQIQRTFERYLAPQVVRRLLETPESVNLGGTVHEVTVLFADLREFREGAPALAPQFLVEQLNLYLALMADAVLQEEGLLDKLFGDTAMALFNVPQAQPDHVARAARAALQIQEAVASYHATVAPEHRLRFAIGLHVGEAIVGNIGSPRLQSYTAVGACVELAFHLQELAAPGQVVISEAVYRHLAGRCEAHPLGAHAFPRCAEPVPVYALTAMTQEEESDDDG
jgi:PAS domain S-box-containing protein